MKSSTDLPRLRLHGPGDVVEAIPILLEFQPAESIVVLLLRDDRLCCVARFDLPRRDRMRHEALAQVARVVRRAGPDLVMAVAYSDLTPPWHDDLLVDLVDDLLDLTGRSMTVGSLVGVSDGWWCELAPGADPQPVPQAGRVSAEAAYHGLPTGPPRTRAEAVASAGAPPGPRQQLAREEYARQRARLRDLPPTVRRQEAERVHAKGLDAPAALGPAEAAVLGLALAPACGWNPAADLERATAGRHVVLWERVVALTADEDAPGPLAMLGLASWLDGRGALLVACLQRGLAIDPGHRMLGMLDLVNAEGLSPDQWDAAAVSSWPAEPPTAGEPR